MGRCLAIIACCTLVAAVAFWVRLASAADSSVAVWLTTSDHSVALARQPDLAFAPDQGVATDGGVIVTLDDTQRYQSIVGFGAAMTDSSSWLLGHLSPAVNTTTMHLLFDPNQGVGLSFVRVPMGASDYTYDGTMYSYDDQLPGQSDPTLAAFTITRDLSYTIPALRDALTLNPALTLLANPWSAPGWMKANGLMSNLGHSGPLLSSAYPAFAQYFVRFIQSYQAQGVPIALVTPENEPGAAGGYPSMDLDPQAEATFVGQNLGPALIAAHLSTKILAFDEGWSNQGYNSAGVIRGYPVTVLADPTANAYLAGVAYHCYDGDPSSMSVMHDANPTKDMYVTECDGAASFWHHAASLIIESTRHWARAVARWNIALNPAGGPENPAGCPGCAPLLTVDPAADAVTPSTDLYQIGQASRFIPPGSVRIGSTEVGPGGLEDAAFVTGDGTHVLLAYNDAPTAQAMTVHWGGASFSTTLSSGATATYIWSGTPPPTPTATPIPTQTPTVTPMPASTSTSSPTPTDTATATPSPAVTASPTSTPSPSQTPRPTATASATATVTVRALVPTPTPRIVILCRRDWPMRTPRCWVMHQLSSS